jgi:hypothetical protein
MPFSLNAVSEGPASFVVKSVEKSEYNGIHRLEALVAPMDNQRMDCWWKIDLEGNYIDRIFPLLKMLDIGYDIQEMGPVRKLEFDYNLLSGKKFTADVVRIPYLTKTGKQSKFTILENFSEYKDEMPKRQVTVVNRPHQDSRYIAFVSGIYYFYVLDLDLNELSELGIYGREVGTGETCWLKFDCYKSVKDTAMMCYSGRERVNVKNGTLDVNWHSLFMGKIICCNLNAIKEEPYNEVLNITVIGLPQTTLGLDEISIADEESLRIAKAVASYESYEASIFKLPRKSIPQVANVERGPGLDEEGLLF